MFKGTWIPILPLFPSRTLALKPSKSPGDVCVPECIELLSRVWLVAGWLNSHFNTGPNKTQKLIKWPHCERGEVRPDLFLFFSPSPFESLSSTVLEPEVEV